MLLAGAGPSQLHAEAKTNKLPIIGFLSPNSQAAASKWTAAFVERLGELGWIELQTVSIAYRWADGLIESAAGFVSELVRLRVDVIVTHGVPNILAAMHA